MGPPTYHNPKQNVVRPGGGSKRRRRVVAAALALAGLAVATAGWAWRTAEQSKQAAARQAREERDQALQIKAKVEKQLEQALAAQQTAMAQHNQARAAESAAKRDAQVSAQVLDFLRKNVLSSGNPKGWGAVADDVTLPQVVEMAEPKVADAFTDEPLAEASIRQILGTTCLDLGETERAIQQYERALALLEAEFGPEHPDTGDCRNQLAVAYRRADREEEASRLFEQTPLTSTHAAVLTIQASALLADGKPAEAELKLRESLRIRQRVQPDDWTTFDAESMLGEARLEQKKYAAAERSLLAGYEGIQQRQAKLSVRDRRQLDRARQRLVRLYEAWGKDDEAAKWRRETAAAAAPTDH